ncbi:MAG: hypothetical protein JWQ21_1971 [Herminiimonas sp.]|nr:hypothetical protein [Herminiimonas sp.]
MHTTWNKPASVEAPGRNIIFCSNGAGYPAIRAHTTPEPDDTPPAENDPPPQEVPQRDPVPVQDPIPHQAPIKAIH